MDMGREVTIRSTPMWLFDISDMYLTSGDTVPNIKSCTYSRVINSNEFIFWDWRAQYII